MTEDEIEKAEEAVQQFLHHVRGGFWEFREKLTEEQFEEYFKPKAQDALSLYSPWMNSKPVIS